jgi:hypothetical protein
MENRNGLVVDACLTEANGMLSRSGAPNDRGPRLRDDRQPAGPRDQGEPDSRGQPR